MTFERSSATTHELFANNLAALEVWERQQLLLPGGARHEAFRSAVPETPLVRLLPEHLPEDLRGTRAEVWIKDDRRMPGKSYKLRGAWNKLRDEYEARGGKVGQVYAITASTGNHLNQVGRAAESLGFAGTFGYVPEAASLAKLYDAITAGVHITKEDDLDAALAAAKKMGEDPMAVYVPPFDDLSIMAGQGTVTLEIAEQLAAHGKKPDHEFFPAGGGGDGAGNRTMLAGLFPEARLTVAQAIGAHGIVLGQSGNVLDPNDFSGKCDGAAVITPGKLPMAILGDKRFTDATTVTDAQIGEAIAVLAKTGEVPEPAGALAMAALLAYLRANPYTQGVLVAHVSGANKTPQKVSEYMKDALQAGLITEVEAVRVNQQAYTERIVDGVDEIMLNRMGQFVGPLVGSRVLSSPAALDNRRGKSS